ncbi:hypothetical protein IPM62_00780 [Candidatus Woesebacteria bacterium]|nr:MAG: hypothetical protein IPM62_00780 [Candidatus Woesebacteria bacterium]
MDNNLVLYMLTLGTLVSLTRATNHALKTRKNNTQKPVYKRLADNFNLSSLDVQAVVDAVNEERKTDFMSNFPQRLDQLVSDKTITAGQKRIILFKKDDIAEAFLLTNGSFEYGNNKGKFANKLKALKAWAKYHNLDLKLFSVLCTNYVNEVEGIYI